MHDDGTEHIFLKMGRSPPQWKFCSQKWSPHRTSHLWSQQAECHWAGGCSSGRRTINIWDGSYYGSCLLLFLNISNGWHQALWKAWQITHFLRLKSWYNGSLTELQSTSWAVWLYIMHVELSRSRRAYAAWRRFYLTSQLGIYLTVLIGYLVPTSRSVQPHSGFTDGKPWTDLLIFTE